MGNAKRMTPPEKNAYAVRIAVLEEKVRSAAEAKTLQAAEYERRLTDLNHAHDQAMARNVDYVSRELHDAAVRELRTLAESIRIETLGATAKNNEEVKSNAKTLGDRVDSLSTKVNVGVGVMLTLQVLLFIVIEVIKK